MNITTEKIADDLIELSNKARQHVTQSLSYKNYLINVLNPMVLAEFFKQNDIIKNLIISKRINDDIFYQDNKKLCDLSFAYNLDNEVLEEMIKDIDEKITEMGKDKEYLKVIYISLLGAKGRIEKNKYLEYITEGLNQFKLNLDILDLSLINKDQYNKNRNFYSRGTEQMNLLCIPTHNMTIDNVFKKEFSIIWGFYTSIVNEISTKIIEQQKSSSDFKQSSLENQKYILERVGRKLKNLSQELFGFKGLEAKIVKTKKLSIEEKEYYLNELMGFFGKKFTKNLKESGAYYVCVDKDEELIKEKDNISLLVSFEENEINVFVNDFIFNYKKNNSIDNDLLTNNEYNIDIKRINRNSALITLIDLTKEKKYCKKRIEILNAFNNKFQELLVFFKDEDKKRTKTYYPSYLESPERRKMKKEMKSFVEVLHQEIRAMKLMYMTEKSDELIVKPPEKTKKKI